MKIYGEENVFYITDSIDFYKLQLPEETQFKGRL